MKENSLIKAKIMKKTIIYFLVITIILMSIGCSGKQDNNEIQLTLENFDQYFSIVGNCHVYGTSHYVSGLRVSDTRITNVMYPDIYRNVGVCGTTDNFNYYNTKIIIKVKGTCEAYDYTTDLTNPIYHNFEFTDEITTNISGNSGYNQKIYNLPDNLVTHEDLMEYDFEVIEVSGYVTPVE